MLFKTVSRVLLADFLYHETVGHFPFTLYTYSIASRGTVKLLSRGKGRSSGKLFPKAEYKKSVTKLGKQFKITNYILYNTLY